MADSGLEAVLQCIYPQLIFGHTFRRKAYARAVCGHMFCASVILSLPLEDVSASLTESQNANLIKIMNEIILLITLMTK